MSDDKQSFLAGYPPKFILGAGIIIGIAVAWGVLPFIANALS